MTTTAVFAEIITVGMQTLAWIALAVWVIASWGDDANQCEVCIKNWLSVASHWAALMSVFVLAMAYTVGVIVDRVADTLLRKLAKLAKLACKMARWFKAGSAKKTKRKAGVETSRPDIAIMRLTVRYKGGQLNGFFEYVRSRLRIARSTVLNIVMGGIVASFAFRGSSRGLTIVIVASVVALAAAIYTWARIKRVYEKRLRQAFRMIESGG